MIGKLLLFIWRLLLVIGGLLFIGRLLSIKGLIGELISRLLFIGGLMTKGLSKV